jgi:ubiquinone/menaquinone biosynthesis C-methylase UbiE
MGDLEFHFWNVYARWYDQLSFLIPYQELQRTVVSMVPALPRGAHLLDAGCGTGQLLARLHRAHPDWKLTGLDRSGTMLRMAEAKLSGVATLTVHDMNMSLPFRDESFDVVLSTNVLYTLMSPELFLDECRRILLPGGTLLMVNPWKSEQRHIWFDHIRQLRTSPTTDQLFETLEHVPAFIAMVMINAIIASRGERRSYHFLPPKELNALVEDCGFTVDRIDASAYAGTCCLIRANAR